MSLEKPKSQNEIDYPSVDLAYNLAIIAYDNSHKRWEAVDNRIQTFLAFAGTIELGLPVVIHTNVPQTRFRSIWFIFALITFVISTLIGLYARLTKKLILIDPNELYYNNWLEYPEWDFKKNFIYWAGKNYQINLDNINLRMNCLIAMIFLFFAGLLFLVIWIIDALA